MQFLTVFFVQCRFFPAILWCDFVSWILGGIPKWPYASVDLQVSTQDCTRICWYFPGAGLASQWIIDVLLAKAITSFCWDPIWLHYDCSTLTRPKIFSITLWASVRHHSTLQNEPFRSFLWLLALEWNSKWCVMGVFLLPRLSGDVFWSCHR